MITGVVDLLRAGLQGLPCQTVPWRRWTYPEAGWSLVVATEGSSWASGPASIRYPVAQIEIITRPTDGQDDAESLGEPVVATIIPLLHWRDRKFRRLSDGTRCLGSQLAGESGPQPVEGREADGWMWRRLTFELLII